MRRIILLISLVFLFSTACENPTGSGSNGEKLISKLVGEWSKVGERTRLDTFYLGIDGASLNCGVPMLSQDSLSIGIDGEYTRFRTAVDPDCCSTRFRIDEKGHLEITHFAQFYVIADSLLIGYCEWCPDLEPLIEIDVSSGLLRLLCCLEGDTIFAIIEESACDDRVPYWYR